MSLKWTKREAQMPSPLVFPDVQYDKDASLDPVKLFELFLDNHIFKHMVEQSRLYRVSKDWPGPNISEEEMKVFLGILVVSGYNKFSSKAMFWSAEGKDLRNQAVYEVTRRDRFDTIMKSLHLHPNIDLDKDDKYSKRQKAINSSKLITL